MLLLLSLLSDFMLKTKSAICAAFFSCLYQFFRTFEQMQELCNSFLLSWKFIEMFNIAAINKSYVKTFAFFHFFTGF